MANANVDFGRVADDLRRAAASFALLTSSASEFGHALNAFREFERQLVLTNSIAQGTVAQFDAMKKAAIDFSLATKTSAVEAGAALQNLAQAGFTAQESLQAMAGVLLLANATMSDVGVAADVITSSIRAFGLEAQDATRISNLFTATITGSLATMSKLTYALRQVGPVAKVAGLSIEETSAYLGELFNIGLRGEQAGTSLRNVIIRLVRPTGQAAQVLEKMGIATVDATGNFIGLEKVLQSIASKNLSEAQLGKIFENEALAGAIRLLKVVSDGTDKSSSSFRKLLDEISGTDRALVLTLKNLDTLDGSLRLAQNAFTELERQLGEAFAPVVRAVAEYLLDLVSAFKALDEGTQQFIAKFAAMAVAAVGLAAVLTSLKAVFSGLFQLLGVKYVGSLLKVVKESEKFGVAMTGIKSALIGSVIPALRAAGAALLAYADVLAYVVVGFAASNPFAATIIGIGAVATAVYGAVAAWNAYSDARNRSVADQRAAEQGTSFAQQILNKLGTDAQFREIDTRLKLAKQLLEDKLIQAISTGDYATYVQSTLASQKFAQSAKDLAARDKEQVLTSFKGLEDQIKTYEALRKKAEEAQKKFAKAAKDPYAGYSIKDIAAFGAAGVAPPPNEEYRAAEKANQDAAQAFEDFQTKLGAEKLAAVEKAVKTRDEYSAKEKAALGQLDESAKTTRNAYRTYLQGFVDGEAKLQGDLAKYNDAFKQVLSQPGVIQSIVSELDAKTKERLTDENLLVKALTAAGVPTAGIAEVYFATQKKIIEKNIGSLQSATQALQRDTLRLKAAAAKAEAQRTKDLTKAIADVIFAGNYDLEYNLEKIATENNKNFQDVFGQLAIGQMQGAREAVIQAFADAKVDITKDDIPTIRDLLNGKYLTDAFNSALSDDTTPEEAAKLWDQKKAEYEAIMQDLINKTLQGLNIPDSVLGQLQNFAKAMVDNVEAAVKAGLSKTSTNVARTTKRITGSGGGKSAAEKAADQAKKLENAFNSAAQEILKAREKYIEAAQGLDIETRVRLYINFDVDKTVQEFDRQIQVLKQKLRDISVSGDYSGAQVEQLKKQYTEAIAFIEKAKAAEVSAANSFVNQMKRRGDAIDLYIRDLKNIAGASQSAFEKVAAGINVAFAEYQKNLVTLTDITSNAIKDTIDAVSSALADFIFDGKNAWENFKNAMLDISRQIFEGFTKSLVQQALSSLTGGPGSITGNALFPSQQQNTGVPGVGGGGSGGGFLGKILSTVFPGLGGAAAGGGAGQGGAGTGNLAGGFGSTVQQFTTQFQKVLNQFLTNITQTLNQFGTQFAQALNMALQQISAATGSTTGGVGFSSVSGGGGILGGLFGSILGGGLFSGPSTGSFGLPFAKGGEVSGPGTGTSDSIMTFLSNGEFVIRSAITSQMKPILAAINDGAISPDQLKAALAIIGASRSGFHKAPIKAFADGGFVTNGYVPPSAPLSMSSLGGRSYYGGAPDQRPIILQPQYIFHGVQEPSNTLRVSAAQHAKQLGAQLERAKKNV